MRRPDGGSSSEWMHGLSLKAFLVSFLLSLSACGVGSDPGSDNSAVGVSSAEPVWSLTCGYAAPEFELHEECASMRPDDTLRLEPERLLSLFGSSSEPAEVWAEAQWYYVLRDGTTAPASVLDNGADPIVEAVFRSPGGGKVGFRGADLEWVIGPRFDAAWPFEGGVALVCVGCREEPVGEHRAVVGGQWGWIDKVGKEVVPITLSEEEARARLHSPESRP